METTLNFDTKNNSGILSCFNPYQALEHRVSSFARSKIQDGMTNDQLADLQQSFKLANSFSFFAGRMKAILATLPKETIRLFLFEIMTAKSQKEIESAFQSTFSVLEKDAFLELSEIKNSTMANLSFKVHGLTKKAALKNSFEREGIAILKEFLIEARYFFHQVLDILINLTGINELTKHRKKGGKETDYAAQAKLDRFWKLLALPATVFGVIYTCVEFKAAALGLTAIIIVAGLTALVAYNRYWKPCPIDCKGLNNLSIDLLRKKDRIYPRRAILARIESAFQAKKGVILVGEPGVGKTQLVNSFVYELAERKICPFLKDAQVFECSTANLTSISDSSISLTSIEDHFKYHEHQVAFFFDEIHTLFPNQKKEAGEATQSNLIVTNNTATGIKKFCEKFSYVIGATTTKEYEQYVQHQLAIGGRRFEIIHLEMMDEEHMEIALSQYFESTYSKITYDPDVFKYIIEKAEEFNPKTSSIDAAMALLNQAIQKMTSVSHGALEIEVTDLEDQLDILGQKLRLTHKKLEEKDLNGLITNYETKETELTKAKQQLEKRRLKATKMQSMENHLWQLKKQAFLMADRNIDLSHNTSLANQWNQLNARIKILEDFIAKEREELGEPKALDQILIDTILKERKEAKTSQKKAEAP